MLNGLTLRRWGSWSILLCVVAFLVLFLALPLLLILWQGLSPAVLYAAMAHPLYRAGFANAALIATVATALTFIISLPLAWISTRYRFKGRSLVEAMLLAPLVLPPFVGALGIAQIFGTFGALNTLLERMGVFLPGHGPDWLGQHRLLFVCVLEALHLYPFVYLNAVTSLSRLDPGLLEAAQCLGASGWVRMRRVVLPLISPGLFAGGVVVFIWSFTELGTPLMLDFDRTTPVQIFNGLLEIVDGGNRVPFALVVIMLGLCTALYLLARLIVLPRHQDLASKPAGAAVPILLGGWPGVLCLVPFLLVVFLAVSPHIAVVLLAFGHNWYHTILPQNLTLEHFVAAIGHPDVLPGVINSLTYAGGATVLTLLLGTYLAWVGVRWRPPFWRWLDAMAMLPLAIPGVVMAFGYFTLCLMIKLTCSFSPMLQSWFNPISNPVPILIIAYAVRRLPYVLRAASSGLGQVPLVLEEAAASVGARGWQRLTRITMPLMVGSLVAGALLTFSYSMLEVSDSLILAQKRAFFPLTRVLYDLVTILGPGPALACALSTWAMLFIVSLLTLAAAVLGKRPSALLRD